MIPVFCKPYEDEWVNGWLSRLATDNGMTLQAFCKMFLSKNLPSGISMEKGWYKLDCDITGWYWIEKNNPLIDGTETLLRNTVLQILIPFYNLHRRALEVSKAEFTGREEGSHSPHREVVFCPACIASDAREGRFPYLRVWHQFDNCAVCAVHGIRLIRIVKDFSVYKNNGFDLRNEKTFSNLAYAPMRFALEDELRYAKFIYDLYKTPLSVSKYTLQELTKEKVDYNGYNLPLFIQKHPVQANSGRFEKRAYVSEITSMIDFVFRAFGTVQEIINYAVDSEWGDITGGLEITKKTCPVCGAIYPWTEGMEKIGTGCPECNKNISEKEKIARQLEVSRGGSYKLEGPFRKYNSRVIHSCGRVLQKGACRKIICWEINCGCKEGRAELAQYKSKFKKRKFKKRKFKKRKYTPVPTIAQFEDTIRQRCGTEYKIDQINGNTAVLIHNCGVKFSITKEHFVKGFRCPFCYSINNSPGPGGSETLIEEYVDRDKTTLVEQKAGTSVFRNFDGTEKRLKLLGLKQELNRLDGAKYIYRKKRLEEYQLTSKAIIFRFAVKEIREKGFVEKRALLRVEYGNSYSYKSLISLGLLEYCDRRKTRLRLSKELRENGFVVWRGKQRFDTGI